MKASRWAVPMVLALALAAAYAAAQSGSAPPAGERIEMRFDADSVPDDERSFSMDTTIGGMRWTHDGSSGDVVRFGEDIVIEAGQRVRGDVVAVGGSVEVRGIVDGDAVALGGRVRIRPGGQVRGEAISLGGKVVHEQSGGVGGSSVSLPGIPSWIFDFNVMNMVGHGIKLLQLLVFLALTLFLAWLTSHLAPTRTLRAAQYVRERPGMAFLWGLGALVGILPSIVAVALLVALLCITIIGIPVAILGLVAYAVGLLVLALWGYFVGAVVVGGWVARRLRPQDGEPSLWFSLLYGVCALFAPGAFASALQSLGVLAPVATGLGVAFAFLNWVLSTVVALLGIGSLLVTRAGTRPSGFAAFAGPPPEAPPAPSGPPVPPPPSLPTPSPWAPPPAQGPSAASGPEGAGSPPAP